MATDEEKVVFRNQHPHPLKIRLLEGRSASRQPVVPPGGWWGVPDDDDAPEIPGEHYGTVGASEDKTLVAKKGWTFRFLAPPWDPGPVVRDHVVVGANIGGGGDASSPPGGGTIVLLRPDEIPKAIRARGEGVAAQTAGGGEARTRSGVGAGLQEALTSLEADQPQKTGKSGGEEEGSIAAASATRSPPLAIWPPRMPSSYGWGPKAGPLCSGAVRAHVSGTDLRLLSGFVDAACAAADVPERQRPARIKVDTVKRYSPRFHSWVERTANFLAALVKREATEWELKEYRTHEPPGNTRWERFTHWLSELALDTEAHELDALVATVMESMLFRHVEQGQIEHDKEDRMNVLAGDVMDLVILHFVRAGWVERAEAFFHKLLALKLNVVRAAWGHNDFRRVTAAWDTRPDMRPLDPGPSLAPEKVLPAGMAEALRSKWRLFAQEAKSAVEALTREEDGYPGITRGKQWQKLELYTAGSGWVEDRCRRFTPFLCDYFKGKLKTETDPEARKWVRKRVVHSNDEVVGLFGITGNEGWALVHNGQDLRINVHLCLLNCNYTRVVVGLNRTLSYFDGSLFAFEDRHYHELFNEGPEMRVNLVIGVLHPDYRGADVVWKAPRKAPAPALAGGGNAAEPPGERLRVVDPVAAWGKALNDEESKAKSAWVETEGRRQGVRRKVQQSGRPRGVALMAAEWLLELVRGTAGLERLVQGLVGHLSGHGHEGAEERATAQQGRRGSKEAAGREREGDGDL